MTEPSSSLYNTQIYIELIENTKMTINEKETMIIKLTEDNNSLKSENNGLTEMLERVNETMYTFIDTNKQSL